MGVDEEIFPLASMTGTLKLMAVLAHPDDESFGTGGSLAKYASEGVETYVVTATRGERGRYHDGTQNPGPDAMGRIRAQELMDAADVLGVREVSFLDYIDGDLDQADPNEAISRIVGHLRRVRPQVVLTFDQAGAYGHADHIAICQFTTAAAVAAADPEYLPGHGEPHAISKLYYFCWSEPEWAAYQTAFKKFTMTVDGVAQIAGLLFEQLGKLVHSDLAALQSSPCVVVVVRRIDRPYEVGRYPDLFFIGVEGIEWARCEHPTEVEDQISYAHSLVGTDIAGHLVWWTGKGDSLSAVRVGIKGGHPERHFQRRRVHQLGQLFIGRH